MAFNPLEKITIESKINVPAGCVIWLHGLGADGSDFVPIVEMLNRPDLRFILPHAPVRPVTLNHGYAMPAWYDIYTLERDNMQDEIGIRTMSENLSELIFLQIQSGIPSERIVLAGFSQGGAMVLHTGLRFPQRLGGILALSTYLALKSMLSTEKSTENQGIPILMAHGAHDSIINLETAELSREVLLENGFHVEWKVYSMEHTVCLEEVEAIREFLGKTLPPLS